MKIAPGTRLGRYEIRSKIGEGGMGEVYLAEDTKLGRKVALKILPIDVAAHQDRMRRFVQEAKAASALNHPNIITIHEIDETDSGHFIATEFIEGETLRERMRNSTMKLAEVIEVATQIASALAAAHAAGIVHRDIKPENVMLRRDGIVKVLDFGLAKLTEQTWPELVDTEAPTRAAIKTEPGMVMGTAIYMSPEQARGLAVDARTDIFSLGVLIYEMVAGRLPFEGSNTNEILASILSDKDPAPLARYAREVPAELERIVAKALRKNREDRYQTSKDLLIDLKSLREELEFERKRELSAPSNSVIARTGLAQHETVIESAARPTTSEARWTGLIKANQRSIVVAVAGLIVVASATAAYFYLTGPRTGAINSVAVLPFADTGRDPNTEYLSEGLTDSLINSLSQLPNMRMIAHASVFRYKGREVDPQEIGRELDVQAVVMGRITQLGDNLSISAELVEVRTNSRLWGEQYNLKPTDILQVQTEIAREISDRLRAKLTGEQQSRLTKRYTENAEAYQLYLKGRFYWNKRSETSVRRGIEYFRQATEVDPNYALAFTGLADSYNVLGILRVSPPEDAYPKAKAAAKKALEIDDSLAEAHTSLARVMADYDWDFAGAEREYRRAIELNPNYPTAHHWFDILLSCNGRHAEALAEAKRAQELDPLSIIITSNVGWIQFNMGQVDQAIEQQLKSLELEPNFVFALDRLGEFYEFKGLYEKAVEAYLKARANSGTDSDGVRALREAYEKSGMKGYWSKRLEQLKKQSQQVYVSAVSIAEVYTRLGEKDQALEWLQKALEDRDTDAIKVNPMLESLRSDPRFTRLLQRVGLPQ